MSEQPDRPDVTAAVARMSRTVSVRRELRSLPALLDPGETVDAIVRGTDGTGFGLLVLTDRRLFFVREGLSSRRQHDMELSSVMSVEWKHDRGAGDIRFVTAGGPFLPQSVGRSEGRPFADAVRQRLGGHLPATGSVAATVVRYPGLPTMLTWSRGYHLVVDPATFTLRHRVDDRGVGAPRVDHGRAGGGPGGAGGRARPARRAGRPVVGRVRRVGRGGRGPGRRGRREEPAGDSPRGGLGVGRFPRRDRAGRGGNTQAWELCTVAGRLAATTTWQQSRIDAARRVPELLWSAARRSIALDVEQADVERAQAHGSLHELARQAGERIATERAAIDAVLRNLRGVLAEAEAVDQLARDQVEYARIRREEQELRNRMLRTYDPLAGKQSNERADGAAGLAAESAEIARLLAEADRYLQ